MFIYPEFHFFSTANKTPISLFNLYFYYYFVIDDTKEELFAKFNHFNYISPEIKEIQLVKGADGLGFSIVGGYGNPHGDFPIYVKNIFKEGVAALSGQLNRGDQIIAVNDISLDGATHEKAVEILKNVSGVVKLTIVTNTSY